MIKSLYLSFFILTIFLLGACKSTNDVNKPVDQKNSLELTSQKNSVADEVIIAKKTLNETSLAEQSTIQFPQSIAILPFFNSTKEPAAPQILRSTLFGHLASTNYRFSHIKDIDNRLTVLDPNQNLTPKDAGFLSNLLDVDGLLFVEILNYDKFYVGIYAQITFSVRVSLVNAKGQTLWQRDFEEISREGGVSMNALSMLYNIAVTAFHLSDENLLAVADKLGRKIYNDFPQPDKYQQVTHSYIDTVLHDGVDKVLRYGDALQVGIKGEANKLASVSIEGIDQVFPLTEKEPGIYLGSISVDRRWNGSELMLTGYLRDSSGTTSKYISSVGLVNFDNVQPEPVRLLRQKNEATRISLEWTHKETDLRFVILNMRVEQDQQVFETYQTEFVWQHQAPLFDEVKLAIIAIDKAGNRSQPLLVSSPVYPLASMYEARLIQVARLPKDLSGQWILLREQGPFIIDQPVIQPPGSTLFIQPGTEIHYSSAGKLLIQGSIFMFGEDLVALKAITGDMAAQTYLTLDSKEHVYIDGVSIQGAGIGIEVLNGKPSIDNCSIVDSQYSAIVVSNSAVVHVKNCVFQGSNMSALVVTDQARLYISDTRFSENFPFHIQSSSIYEQEAINNVWQPAASAMTILGKVRY
ncbi:MAG: right-handed parallel beta-helix repeat-containing protein [Paraglaciecola sp.]|uniref:right-handed parallel beta-helix repeat-containing protein n=1 Tax=Paraglaciecola sp. TaxID=1920173 RepID=UPI00273DFE20|nr:right-handed parallel beta-helix repeat-containing protein [Paraglaciecola sp.]MDP5031398.1 right-handed parallel beta-helix repeat-containing protein [Paraglaciecola sp.]MDP5133176.1 right-handed parallel beta-helix repeat-containing protein [Paraglaciecola sp.]